MKTLIIVSDETLHTYRYINALIWHLCDAQYYYTLLHKIHSRITTFTSIDSKASTGNDAYLYSCWTSSLCTHSCVMRVVACEIVQRIMY